MCFLAGRSDTPLATFDAAELSSDEALDTAVLASAARIVVGADEPAVQLRVALAKALKNALRMPDIPSEEEALAMDRALMDWKARARKAARAERTYRLAPVLLERALVPAGKRLDQWRTKMAECGATVAAAEAEAALLMARTDAAMARSAAVERDAALCRAEAAEAEVARLTARAEAAERKARSAMLGKRNSDALADELHAANVIKRQQIVEADAAVAAAAVAVDAATAEAARASASADAANVCIVCMERPRKMVFSPCLHFVVCQECSEELKRVAFEAVAGNAPVATRVWGAEQPPPAQPRCPMCREEVTSMVGIIAS